MRQAAILFATLLSLGLTGQAQAQNAADPAEWMMAFMARAARHTDLAYRELKAETHLGQVGGPIAEILSDAHRGYVAGHGPAQAHEIVSEQQLGHRLRRVTAVMHYPKHPQLFVADFYQQTPGNGWHLIGMKIDTNSLSFPWQEIPQDPPVVAGTGPERRAANE